MGQLRTRLAELSGGGPLDSEDHAQVVSDVLGSERIALGHGYRLLTPSAGDGPSSEPVRFRFEVDGMVTNWWVCLPGPAVQPQRCPTG